MHRVFNSPQVVVDHHGLQPDVAHLVEHLLDQFGLWGCKVNQAAGGLGQSRDGAAHLSGQRSPACLPESVRYKPLLRAAHPHAPTLRPPLCFPPSRAPAAPRRRRGSAATAAGTGAWARGFRRAGRPRGKRSSAWPTAKQPCRWCLQGGRSGQRAGGGKAGGRGRRVGEASEETSADKPALHRRPARAAAAIPQPHRAPCASSAGCAAPPGRLHEGGAPH